MTRSTRIAAFLIALFGLTGCEQVARTYCRHFTQTQYCCERAGAVWEDGLCLWNEF